MHLANIAQGRGNLQEAEKLRADGLRIARQNALAEIPVLYGTDRARGTENANRLAYASERAHRLELGQASVIFADQLPAVDTASSSASGDVGVKFATHERATGNVDVADMKTLSAGDFSAAARGRIVRAKRYPGQALVLVHGFNTSFEAAVQRAAKLAQAIEYDGLVFVYS
jgi:esterase/lipase superfamily enzyme